MKRILSAFLIALFILCAPISEARFPRGAVNGIASGWHTLPVGGGGFATGIDMQADGTKLSRTNTGGAYKWNGSAWVQLVDNTLPSAVWTNNQTIGVMEIVAAPSATSTCFMHYFGFMLKSTTGCSAGTWSNLTGWTQDSDLSNAGSAQFGAAGPLIAVDPINSSVVLGGSNNTGASGGLYLSSNGGTAWAAVSTVAQSSSFINVAFDPSSAQTGGKTQGIYACSNGTGCYHSINGGSTWTSIVSGGPTACIRIIVDVNGNLWCADLSVWKYNGTSWSHTIATQDQNGYFSVAVDPNSSTHIFAVTLTGNLNVSLNTGTSWSGPAGTGLPSPLVSATDVPWLAVTAQSFMTIGQIAFDPVSPNKLYAAAGTGIFTITPPTASVTTTPLTWASQTAGQETLVVNQVVASPSGAVVTFNWDRICFKITSLNAYSNAETCFPSQAPLGAWASDWCTGSTSTFVQISSQAFGSGQDHSGVSSNDGLTWTQFASLPSLIGQGAWHGGIACGGSNKHMYIQGDTSGLPSYTGNGGSSWASITGTSLPTNGWTGSGVSNRRVAADRVTADKYYIANDGATAPGLYTCASGACVRTTTSLPDSGEPMLVTVPGQAAHIFGLFFQHSLQFTTNGGTSWTSISKFAGTTITSVGFGATFPGKSYPSVYVAGIDSGASYGIWQCKDFNSATGACTSTWTNLNSPLSQFNLIQWVDGDKITPGLVYLGTNGNGAIYGN